MDSRLHRSLILQKIPGMRPLKTSAGAKRDCKLHTHTHTGWPGGCFCVCAHVGLNMCFVFASRSDKCGKKSFFVCREKMKILTKSSAPPVFIGCSDHSGMRLYPKVARCVLPHYQFRSRCTFEEACVCVCSSDVHQRTELFHEVD